MIKKQADKYFLSQEGKIFQLETLSVNKDASIVDEFNIASLVILTNSKNEVLYQKRKRQPTKDWIMLPGRRLKKGELAEEAACRCLKLEAKVDTSPEDMEFKGILRKIIYENEIKSKVYSDFFFHVLVCKNYSGEPVNTEYGSHFWKTKQEAINHQENYFLAGNVVAKVIENLDSKIPIFYVVEEKVIPKGQ